MSLRFVFTKGIAMCKPAIPKNVNAKKLTIKNVLNDQKYEILQNSKIFHTQSKLPNLQIGKVLQQKDHLKVLKTEMTFFILIGKGPHSS